MREVKTGWFGFLCLLAVTSFINHPNYQLVNSASEGFSLRGPTHCFSVGVGYDSKFLFSIRSLGYTGPIDFEVSAPDGIEVDLKTPVFLNSTGAGAYCPITVRATSKANYGNQSIQIMARGETYTDSITVCILVVGFTTLTMQTSPIGIAVDIFLDNTKYQLKSQPLVLRIRAGHHSIQLITNSSTLGSNNYVSEGLDFTNIDGNTTYYTSSGRPLTLDIVDKSTITIRFREGLSTTTETTKLTAPVATDMVLVSFIVLAVVILAAIAVYFWRRQTRVASVEGTKDNDAPVASTVLNS
jgi:hypothetical protein